MGWWAPCRIDKDADGPSLSRSELAPSGRAKSRCFQSSNISIVLTCGAQPAARQCYVACSWRPAAKSISMPFRSGSASFDQERLSPRASRNDFTCLYSFGLATLRSMHVMQSECVYWARLPMNIPCRNTTCAQSPLCRGAEGQTFGLVEFKDSMLRESNTGLQLPCTKLRKPLLNCKPNQNLGVQPSGVHEPAVSAAV